MFTLNLPDFDVKIKKAEGLLYIWDRLRHKYVRLTPEEWVRQHFINYLITEKGYPEVLVANERQIILNKQKKRCDSVVFNNQLTPLAIIEYKSPEVKITQSIFDQIVRYNIVLKVDYLIVSNGMDHYCCKLEYSDNTFTYLPEIPHYNLIK